MKNLLLQAHVVVRTSNLKISRCCLADYVKTLHQKACRMCSTIIFLHSTNQIIDLWRCRCRCRCRRQILNSLFTNATPQSTQDCNSESMVTNMLIRVSRGTRGQTGFKAERQADTYFFGTIVSKRLCHVKV